MATAIVAALVALAGVLAARWLFNVPVLSPERNGAYGDVHTTGFVLGAAFAALVATAVMHLLLLSTPAPRLFFGWIVALATAIAVLLAFQATAPLGARVATALVYVAIGIAIGSLINAGAVRATRYRGPLDGQPTGSEYQDYERLD